MSTRRSWTDYANVAIAAKFLALLLLFTLPAAVRAQFTYTVSSGAVTITGYTGSVGAVTIPSAIGGLPVTTIGANAFESCNRMTSVVIPNSVTSIGNYAFQSCFFIKQIALPDSVSFLGNWVFCNCTNLTNIAIPNTIAIASIGTGAFDYCIRLSRIAIPDSVTSIGTEAFMHCTALTSVTIGKRCGTIDDIAFIDCGNLAGVYFQGNAPWVGASVFSGDSCTVFYLPGTTGWRATFGGRPTALWNPQARTSDPNFGVRSNQFGFPMTGTSGLVIVVEACTDLVNPLWTAVGTNTLTVGLTYFGDSQWANYPGRFYRLRSP